MTLCSLNFCTCADPVIEPLDTCFNWLYTWQQQLKDKTKDNIGKIVQRGINIDQLDEEVGMFDTKFGVNLYCQSLLLAFVDTRTVM